MIGTEIRRERRRAGLAGHLVCRQTGVGRARLSDIERGYVKPSESEVERIRSAIEKLARAKHRMEEVAVEVGWPFSG